MRLLVAVALFLVLSQAWPCIVSPDGLDPPTLAQYRRMWPEFYNQIPPTFKSVQEAMIQCNGLNETLDDGRNIRCVTLLLRNGTYDEQTLMRPNNIDLLELQAFDFHEDHRKAVRILGEGHVLQRDKHQYGTRLSGIYFEATDAKYPIFAHGFDSEVFELEDCTFLQLHDSHVISAKLHSTRQIRGNVISHGSVAVKAQDNSHWEKHV